jgi:hypothetical protein
MQNKVQEKLIQKQRERVGVYVKKMGQFRNRFEECFEEQRRFFDSEKQKM